MKKILFLLIIAFATALTSLAQQTPTARQGTTSPIIKPCRTPVFSAGGIGFNKQGDIELNPCTGRTVKINGQTITPGGGGSNVIGNLSVGKIPKFGGGTELENSVISQTGTSESNGDLIIQSNNRSFPYFRANFGNGDVSIGYPESSGFDFNEDAPLPPRQIVFTSDRISYQGNRHNWFIRDGFFSVSAQNNGIFEVNGDSRKVDIGNFAGNTASISVNWQTNRIIYDSAAHKFSGTGIVPNSFTFLDSSNELRSVVKADGLPGDFTANSPAFRGIIPIGETSVTVTNNLISPSSIVICSEQRVNTGTTTAPLAANAGSGSVQITIPEEQGQILRFGCLVIP